MRHAAAGMIPAALRVALSLILGLQPLDAAQSAAVAKAEFDQTVRSLTGKKEYAQAIEAGGPLLSSARKTFGDVHMLVGYMEYRIGDCYRNMDQPALAIEHFQRALPIFESQLEPDLSLIQTIRYLLGVSHNSLGQFVRAQRYLRRSKADLLGWPDSEQKYEVLLTVCSELATCYLGQGQAQKAIEEIQSLLEILGSGPATNPSLTGDAQYYLGNLYWKQGDYDNALTTFMALAEKEDPRAQYFLGRMHEEGKGTDRGFQ